MHVGNLQAETSPRFSHPYAAEHVYRTSECSCSNKLQHMATLSTSQLKARSTLWEQADKNHLPLPVGAALERCDTIKYTALNLLLWRAYASAERLTLSGKLHLNLGWANDLVANSK